MSKGVDRMMAYRTMRAVEKQREDEDTREESEKSRWERWQAKVNRVGDKLLGSR